MNAAIIAQKRTKGLHIEALHATFYQLAQNYSAMLRSKAISSA